MLFLLALLILGIVWVASALIDNDAASMESLYGKLVIFNNSLRDTRITFALYLRSLGILPTLPLLLYISNGRTAFTA